MLTSLQKAMDILTVISDVYEKSITLDEISKKLSLNKSTCVHILNTLCEGGFVDKVSHTKGYRLGPSVFYLTRYGKFNEELIQICHPMLRWLNKQVNQTVLLAILHNEKKFIIHYIEGEKKIAMKRTDLILGNVYSTATGRVLLSYMDRREQKEFCEKYGLPTAEQWKEFKSQEDFLRELDVIRKQDFILTKRKIGNTYEYGYASEIHNSLKTVGSIGIAIPDEDKAAITEKQKRHIEKCLMICSKEINRRLSYETNV